MDLNATFKMMQDMGMARPQFMDPMASIVSVMGGSEAFDMWLTGITENVVSAKIPVPEGWVGPHSPLPPFLKLMVSDPRGLVDYILDSTHMMGTWTYKARVPNDKNGKNGKIEVVDQVSGHVIEEVEATDENKKALEAKYAPCLKWEE